MNTNQQQWERFAHTNSMYYIATDAKNAADFWQHGETNFRAHIKPLLEKYSIRGTAADFGCGIGRHTFPLATAFKRVQGIDVSHEMLAQAHEKLHPAVEFLHNDEFFSRHLELVDFIYSANVFQHIEDFAIIEQILRAMAAKLAPGAYAYLHFDTRPQTPLYHIKNKIPDFVLPRSQRRGIGRIRRHASELTTILKRIGYSIVDQHQPGTEYHFILVRRAI